MNLIVAVGTACLALFVGSTAGRTLVRLARLTMHALAGIVALMAGTMVMGMFKNTFGTNPQGFPAEVWLFPARLLAGVFAAERRVSLEKRRPQPGDINTAVQKATETARTMICNLLADKRRAAISFDGIRRGTGQDWDGAYLLDLTRRCPGMFRKIRIKPEARPGLKLLSKAGQNA